MKLLTRQMLADTVAERWKKQYPEDYISISGSSDATWHRLEALGPNPAIEDVNEIIGNTSWTYISCDECRKDMNAVIAFDDYMICKDCMYAAMNLIINKEHYLIKEFTNFSRRVDE